MNRKGKKLESELRRAIEDGVVISHDPVGPFGCIVYVSAMFADGDHPVVRLTNVEGLDRWYFCDDGHTFMRQGAGTIEMSLRLNSRDTSDFVDDLRTFVDVLLMVDASRTKV